MIQTVACSSDGGSCWPRTLGTAELVEIVRDRIQFRDLKEILKAQDAATSAGGWQQLISEIESNPAKGAALTRLMAASYTEIALAGSKEIYIYHLEDDAVQSVASAFGVMAASGAYADAFPMPVNATQLSAMNSEHKLAKVIVRDNGDVSLVFCAKRIVHDKTEYRFDQVTAAVRAAFPGSSKFIAINTKDYQVFDVVNFRKGLKRLEVLIDQPDKSADKDDVGERALNILGLLSTSCAALHSIYEVNAPLNLFNCIGGIYNKAGEGRIQKIAFRAPSKSMKKESVNSGDDLRNEEYHEAGVGKVGTIAPYDITVTWANLGNAGAASLRVHAPVASLSTAGAYVRTARLVDGKTDKTVVAAINKLVSYST